MAYIVWLTSSTLLFNIWILQLHHRREGMLTQSAEEVWPSRRWCEPNAGAQAVAYLSCCPYTNHRLNIWGVMVRNWNSIPHLRRYSVNTFVDAKINTLESEGKCSPSTESEPSVPVNLTCWLTRRQSKHSIRGCIGWSSDYPSDKRIGKLCRYNTRQKNI